LQLKHEQSIIVAAISNLATPNLFSVYCTITNFLLQQADNI